MKCQVLTEVLISLISLLIPSAHFTCLKIQLKLHEYLCFSDYKRLNTAPEMMMFFCTFLQTFQFQI